MSRNNFSREALNMEDYACECLKIKVETIKEAVNNNKLKTFEDVGEYFQTDWVCCDCRDNIQLLVDLFLK